MNKIICLWICCVFTQLTTAQNKNSITGKITDEDNQPLAGVSIHLLNTLRGASTQEDGTFIIQDVPPGSYVLQITIIGYANKNMPVVVGENIPPFLAIQLSESTTELDNVVVTAQKIEEDLQTTPVSITAISSRQTEDFRLWNTDALTALAPNLYSTNSGDNRNVTAIRGITSTSYDPAVATYIDGVNQFSLDTYIAQLFDVERIEVLRGPQGTLYGRNAMGGVINIITKQPTNKTTGFGEVNLGQYHQQRYALGIRTPLIKNKLFLGGSMVLDKSDGFYTNVYDNSNFDKKHSLLGNYFLKYLINSNWEITLNVKHNTNRNFGAFPLAGTPQDALANPFTVDQNDQTELVDNVMNTSLSVQHSGKKMTFTSQTSYQSNYRYYTNSIDGDFSSFDIVSIYNNYGKDWNKVNAFIQEFRLSSPQNGSPLKWTAGAYYFSQRNPVKQTTEFGEDAAYYGAEPNTAIINTSDGTNTGFAIYGQTRYTIKQLEFMVGLRFDHERREQNILGEYSFDPASDPIVIQPDTATTNSYQAISPTASISYHFPHSMAYISYSRGFRTGGFTPFSGDPSQPALVSYKPEYSNNVELGLKNTVFNNQLNINLTTFFLGVKDIQVPTLVLPQAITVTKNAGELRSYGIELEASGTPVKGLTIQYNIGYTHARYTQLKLALSDGENTEEVNFNNNYQIFTPSITSLLAMQYEWRQSNGSFKIISRMEWMYLGEHYFDLANTIHQSPYSTFNTRLTFVYQKFSWGLWGRNIIDEKYIAYAYDFGATHLGDPANWGVMLKYSF